MNLENQTFDLLEQTKTNWTVNKLPLISQEGLSTESYGIFRNDTNLWLGTVGKLIILMLKETISLKM